MKRTVTLLVVSLVFIVSFTACLSMLNMPGCAATGSSVGDNAFAYRQAEDIYASTVRTMTDLSVAGKVTLPQAERFEKVRQSASRLLDEWRGAVLRGEAVNYSASLDSILGELIRIQLEAERMP